MSDWRNTVSEKGDRATIPEILNALHEADGYLSLIGYRHRDGLDPSLVEDLIAASTKCRSLAQRIQSTGINVSTTLTPEDWFGVEEDDANES